MTYNDDGDINGCRFMYNDEVILLCLFFIINLFELLDLFVMLLEQSLFSNLLFFLLLLFKKYTIKILCYCDVMF